MIQTNDIGTHATSSNHEDTNMRETITTNNLPQIQFGEDLDMKLEENSPLQGSSPLQYSLPQRNPKGTQMQFGQL